MSKSSSRVYYMAVFYTVFYSLIRLTSLPVTSNIIRYFTDGGMIVCSLFFLMVWISQPHVKILEKIVGLIMVAVACLLLVTYHYRILLELSFLLSTRSKVLFDDILERIVKYSLIVFCLIFFCSLLGITKNVEYARNDMYEVETNFKALSFGFFYYYLPYSLYFFFINYSFTYLLAVMSIQDVTIVFLLSSRFVKEHPSKRAYGKNCEAKKKLLTNETRTNSIMYANKNDSLAL